MDRDAYVSQDAEVVEPKTPRWPEWIAVVSFLVSAGAAVAVTFVYAAGGDPQLEGLLLGIAFAGLGIGFITWAHRLLPHGPYVEPRPELSSGPKEREATDEDFARGGLLTRRRVLVGSLLTAAGAMMAAAVFPLRSLGPSPDGALRRTPWRRGLALVNEEGRAVHASEVPTGGLVTVFPDGHPGSADGQTVLIRLDESASAAGGTASGGFIAYSKICTHAGCPASLYEQQTNRLLCPCHQSQFNIIDNARPIFGPATRRLPMLPLAVNSDGYFVAGILQADGTIVGSDYKVPVGPGFWERP